MALLIALSVTRQFHPLAPPFFNDLAAILSAWPAMRIARKLLPPALVPLLWGLLVLYLLGNVLDMLLWTPALERLGFGAEILLALGFLIWLLRPSRVARIPAEMPSDFIFRWAGSALRTAAVLLAIAIVADLAGWGDLASILGYGTLASGYSAIKVYAMLKVVGGLMTFALVIRPLKLLRGIARHRDLVRKRIAWALEIVAGLVWLRFVLDHFGVLDPVIALLVWIFQASLTVGSISVSVADVVAFGSTIWVSFLLAGFVDFMLREDVFSRVGIGFGLQNVVNNFVSGLILLFERPIQVGDAVQLPDMWGEVRRIGIRASVIRTFDGAEVIVPNGNLLSDRITNWTLSDRRRRIEVNVGVEYGTPARQVIDLPLEARPESAPAFDRPRSAISICAA